MKIALLGGGIAGVYTALCLVERGYDAHVFEAEPLAAESPLWDLPNVIVSPHNAQASAGNDGRAMQIFLANLVKWAQGKPLQNEVVQA